MSLWTMLPSPLIFGGNPMRLSTDAWTRRAADQRGGAGGQPGRARRARQADGLRLERILGARSQRRAQGGGVLQPRDAGRDDVGDVFAAGRHGDARDSRPVAARRRDRHDDLAVRRACPAARRSCTRCRRRRHRWQRRRRRRRRSGAEAERRGGGSAGGRGGNAGGTGGSATAGTAGGGRGGGGGGAAGRADEEAPLEQLAAVALPEPEAAPA